MAGWTCALEVMGIESLRVLDYLKLSFSLLAQ
jgi:hypothetical protein